MLAILAPNSNSSTFCSKVLGKSRFQLDAVALTCRHEWKAKELFAEIHETTEYIQRITHDRGNDCFFSHVGQRKSNNEAEAVALAMEHQATGPSDSYFTKVS